MNMKKIINFIMLICFCIIMCGCGADVPDIRIVTGITVTEYRNGQSVEHTFTQDQKTSFILNYLRILDPYISVPLSPDTFRTDTYRITVTYSDGNSTHYNQIHHNYFQTENGNWKRIDPDIGARLQGILQSLDNDI